MSAPSDRCTKPLFYLCNVYFFYATKAAVVIGTNKFSDKGVSYCLPGIPNIQVAAGTNTFTLSAPSVVQELGFSMQGDLTASFKWHYVDCRDAVILQHQYEMPGDGVHYSVFDNLLLVHLGHSGRAQIIDVACGGSAAVPAAQCFAMAQPGVRR